VKLLNLVCSKLFPTERNRNIHHAPKQFSQNSSLQPQWWSPYCTWVQEIMAYVTGWSLASTTWLLLDKARLSGGTHLPIDLLQQPKVNFEDVESTNDIFSGILSS